MKSCYLPVALVQAWVYIMESQHEDLHDNKHHVDDAIKENFGSLEIAKFYIEYASQEQMDEYIV